MDTNREQEAMTTFYSSFRAGNTHRLHQAVSADWRDLPPGPGQGPGPDGFMPLLEGFLLAIPDMEIVVLDVLHLPGRAAVRAELRGTHLGNLMGLAATGRPVRLAIHEFHAFRDGRISATWHMEDWFSLFRSLGAFPPVDGAP